MIKLNFSSFTLSFLVVFSNFVSYFLGSSVIFLRDILVYMKLVRFDPKTIICCLLSASLVIVYLFQTDFQIFNLAKFRNFISFPLVLLLLYKIDKEDRLVDVFNKVSFFRVLLYFLYATVLLEVVVQMYSPHLYSVYHNLMSIVMKEKNVDVGLSGGLLLDYRLITIFFNPVQFSIVLFWFYVFSNYSNRAIILFICVFLCVSKSFILAVLIYHVASCKSSRLFYVYLGLLLMMVSLLFLNYNSGTHSGSLYLRLQSIVFTLEDVLTSFLPLDFARSFIVLPDISPDLIYGFESYVFSFVSFTGVPGLILVFVYFMFVSLAKLRFSFVFFILFIYSDNVNSLYLFFVPLIILYTIGSRRYLTSMSGEFR